MNLHNYTVTIYDAILDRGLGQLEYNFEARDAIAGAILRGHANQMHWREVVDAIEAKAKEAWGYD